MGQLADLTVADIGASGLLGVAILLILTGLLVPRRQLKDAQADRDYWRATADGQQRITLEQGATLEKLTSATEKLLIYAETTQHVVTEIQRAGEDP